MESHLIKEYKAKVLYQNKKYSIELTKNNDLVVVTDQLYTDWIMIYDDKTIAFDNPYKLPKYIREKAKQLAQTLTKY